MALVERKEFNLFHGNILYWILISEINLIVVRCRGKKAYLATRHLLAIT